ncbi:alpha/beta hydrolase [Pseudomonas sp. gcc21]|uniref:alpha/beta fold hydrolase n=1 Tax=Pseudomonas sp. gcc21 TaxID=2726989 RepID=UPI001451388E|nr:alpha/beta hydrolase [Pseudomonas sp. gcc21]QJD60434.1 alpha/beta hydrolase [Pseudomonas sp. gcc21]
MSQSVEGIDLSSWVEQSEVFEFQGHALRYWEAGEGEPLLLIHGFPSGSWDWQHLWRPLAQRYRVIACDMLGFGFSAKPRGHRYSLIEQADIQQALMTHLGIRRYHVLAHDYGDSVAQELLARDGAGPSFLASLCFLNGGLFPETHRPVLVQKLLMSPFGFLVGKGFNQDKLRQNFGRVFGPDTQPSERELAGFWEMIACNNGQAIMHRLIRYMPERKVHRDRWVIAMQKTRVPMRVIDGAADPVSGAHMVARYRELITRADTVLLDGIGHYPQVEAPEQVLAAYLDFRSEKAEAA